jgi:uroporphyrinogen decarboxylase
MTNRDAVLDLIASKKPATYVPAAFFLHFDPAYHQGQAAIDKHLEFFRYTGMDFVKIQYEQTLPPSAHIRKAEDWNHALLFPHEFFDAPVEVARGLVKAAGKEALVIMTLYSPFMWARHLAGDENLAEGLREKPEVVRKGLEIMTENVLTLVRRCKKIGIDGFYASSQGGEAFRFAGTDIFGKYIKPSDLAVWEELHSCPFNILHICDYHGSYDDLGPFLDYPGQVVNCNQKLSKRSLSPVEISKLFKRPYMGGLDRKGVISSGNADEIRKTVEGILDGAPEKFILAADCTVPGETLWENLKTAIDTAHNYHKS